MTIILGTVAVLLAAPAPLPKCARLVKTIKRKTVQYSCTKAGKRHGAHQVRSRRGKLIHQGQYRKGKRHGTWTEWSYWPSDKWSVTNYHRGKLHGKSWRFTSGNLKEVEHYRHGKLHGDYSLISPQATLSITGQYRDGKKTGWWERVESGSTKRCFWKNNRKTTCK